MENKEALIEIIYGAKGSGKTKKMIDMVNSGADENKGIGVVLTTTTRYRTEIKPEIRVLDLKESKIESLDALIGYIKGLIGGNYDIEYVYFDGAAKLLDVDVGSNEMGKLFAVLAEVSVKTQVHFVLTVSCDKEQLPPFIAQYIK